VIFYDGTQLSNITLGTGLVCCQNTPVAVNDSGAIAFRAISGADGDVFLFDGTLQNLSTNVAHTNGLVRINDSGNVLFQTGPELFLYDGSSTTNLTSTFGLPGGLTEIAFNNDGEIAFITGGTELWFLGPGGLVQVFSPGNPIGGLDMNDNGEIVTRVGDIFLFTRQDVEPLTLDIQPHSHSNSINCNNDKKVSLSEFL